MSTFKDFKANKEILEKVLDPYLKELEDKFAQATKNRIDHWSAKLKESDMDLDKCCPRPNGGMDKITYRMMLETHNFVASFTNSTVVSRRRSEPNTREISQPSILNLIKISKDEAKADFLAYISKLTGKIQTTIKSAELKGNLWQGSMLYLDTEDGEQKWKTQMIINTSKYGKPFNQFPTRLMK
jgi:DNA modification methylase